MTSCDTCVYYDAKNEWCTHPDIYMLVTGGYFQSCAEYIRRKNNDQVPRVRELPARDKDNSR